MSPRALILACLLCAGTSAAQQTYPLATDELLRSARIWEARDRGDMAKLAFEKLIAARPDSPQALLELGELHLRMADVGAARHVLDQLSSRFRSTPEARTMATELRVATRDRLQLASAQRLTQVNQGAQAKVALDKLFPDGPPDGMYAVEYYQILAHTPGGWERARDGLRRMASHRPDDPRYQLALARQLLRRDDTELAGLQMLHELAQRDDVRPREIDGDLASAITSLGYARVPADILRAYDKRHPDDAAVRRLLEQRLQVEAEERLLLRTADTAVNPARQRQRLHDLQSALFDSTSSFEQALAALRALRGETNAGRFDAPTAAALAWARRGMESAKQDETRADLEHTVALALTRHRYEDAIALADKFKAIGADSEAQELLATASLRDPDSTWLFETQVRSLLDRGETQRAIELLEHRPLSARWTAASRDELLASALDRRAQAALADDQVARAREDLERAIRLQPRYPWTRYRLAGILSREGQADRGAELMHEGMIQAPENPEMRYAQALYLSSIDDYAGALATLDTVSPAARTSGMQDLHGRLRVAVARSEAQKRHRAGDIDGARKALSDVEPLAADNLDRARELANAWFDLGDANRALETFTLYSRTEHGRDTDTLVAWADLLNRAEDPRLSVTLAELQARSDLTPAQRQEVARLERTTVLREVRVLQRERRFDEAARRLDALLAQSPGDREIRVARADLEMAAGRPQTARDQYATLVAESPDDLWTRLDYVRALTDSSDLGVARMQLQSVIERAPPMDVELGMSIARRQLALDDFAGAGSTLRNVLAVAPDRTDAMILRESIEARRRHWMEAGIESRHKPGDPGVSKFDALAVPTLWSYGYDYEHRFTLRADAITVDAGTLPADFDTAALLGTVQASGPSAARRYRNDSQEGVSLGLVYSTDSLTADIGTTPLGFLLSNVVGGVEWTPDWRDINVTLGLGRRAVTSSVLSYAGMRDPITGREWGGVVETGPYFQAGLYRELFSVTGSVRYTQLDGKNVPDNTYLGTRLAADWKFLAQPVLQAFVGAAVSYWSFDKNLQNYTFGHGGYYSPQQYVSITLPLEVQGAWHDWSYRARVSLAYSNSEIDRAPFYPTDPALQAAAASQPLPSGFTAPFHDNEGSSGTSLSAYAAIERRLTRNLVIGAKLDIDRADYYEPTIVMLYVRHVFGTALTPLQIPPRPLNAY